MRKHVIILLVVALLPFLGLLCSCPFAAHSSVKHLSEHLHGSVSSARLYVPYFAVRTADWFERTLHLPISYDAAIRWFYALPILIFLPGNLLLLLGVLTKTRSCFIAAYITLPLCLLLFIPFLNVLHLSFPIP